MAVQGYLKDKNKMKHGAPVTLGRNANGTMRTIWVKPLNSTRYEDRLSALRKPHGRAILKDPELDRSLQIQAVAEVVLDRTDPETGKPLPAWENFLDENGTSVEPTLANKIRELTEDRDLWTDVTTAAALQETFEIQATEDNAGN